jgi:hypothetical protein
MGCTPLDGIAVPLKRNFWVRNAYNVRHPARLALREGQHCCSKKNLLSIACPIRSLNLILH